MNPMCRCADLAVVELGGRLVADVQGGQLLDRVEGKEAERR